MTKTLRLDEDQEKKYSNDDCSDKISEDEEMSESLVIISIQNLKEFTTLATERDLCISEKLDKSLANSELTPEEGSIVT